MIGFGIDHKTLSITEAHELLKSRRLSVRDLCSMYLEEAHRRNPEIHAYLEIFPDINDQIAAAQKRFDDGTATLLTGMPLAFKDNILVKGRAATAASEILKGFVAPYDATVSARLRAHDAVIVGRANMDEFAMGSSTENSAFGVTRNPHDVSRVPGGSSGGSAAAVAMGAAIAALGTDTGGSVRQPAAFCGCVGLKPTYGAVSRHGLIAMGSSLDQAGPLSRTVSDAQVLFDAIKGADPMDATAFYPDSVPQVPEKLRIGIPRELLAIDGLSEEVRQNFAQMERDLSLAGHTLVDVSVPSIALSLPIYYIVMPAEVSSNLARYDGVKYGLRNEGANLLEDYLLTRREGFGKEVRRRILLGTYVLSSGYYDAYYGKANDLRQRLRDEFNAALAMCDVIMTPTTPTPAFKIGEKATDPLQMYLADVFTVSANITMHPAISVPSGFVETPQGNLPLGIQFIAADYRENNLFKAGKEVEAVRHG
jgi:aspartyl-tRNA(Asn)/glutamyl-tRNA(Gln) amidotransferase subunit A